MVPLYLQLSVSYLLPHGPAGNGQREYSGLTGMRGTLVRWDLRLLGAYKAARSRRFWRASSAQYPVLELYLSPFAHWPELAWKPCPLTGKGSIGNISTRAPEEYKRGEVGSAIRHRANLFHKVMSFVIGDGDEGIYRLHSAALFCLLCSSSMCFCRLNSSAGIESGSSAIVVRATILELR